MNILKEMLHNFAMSFSVVQNYAKKYHKTGINESPDAIEGVLKFYRSHTDFQKKDVLDFGPGQTLGILTALKKAGSKGCFALDITRYFSDAYATSIDINYSIYDGKNMPYESEQFDIVLSYDVLEHVRHPKTVIAETARVLRKEGCLISRIDLRDHFYLTNDTKWLNCFKYSTKTWHFMVSNRSNFINRLRLSEWHDILSNHFSEIQIIPYSKKSLLQLKNTIPNLQKMPNDDISTYQIDIICKK